MKTIGFATQFYTLWDYEKIPQYKTDSYGNHHPVGFDHKYTYIKNISTDLDKVTRLYPSVKIDNELRGTSSFTRNEKLDLPEGYFWGGKYAGKLISDIMESDFEYCLWSAENYGGKTAKFIISHPKYKAHFEAIEKEKQEKINSLICLKVGDVVEMEFSRNGYNINEEGTECLVDGFFEDLNVILKCSGVKEVNGMYPYLMPVINGKAQKTKNKTLTVTIIEAEPVKIIYDYYGNEIFQQFVSIK